MADTPKATRAASTRTKSHRAKSTRARPAAARPKRDGDGRFKPDHRVRNAAFGATGLLAAAAAGIAAAFKFGLLDRFLPSDEGHDAPDLALDLPRPGADARAPAAFRPDIDAPMTRAEREALRPATGPTPTIVADEGELAGA